MIYHHSFEVHASLDQVREFHSQAASMSAITPPPLKVHFNNTPEILNEGDEMDFSMGFGPLSIRWVAKIEDVLPNGFTDRQVSGPFSEWVHRHIFNPVDEQHTEVVDKIFLKPRSNPIWWLLGMGMWIGLPILFAFRAYRTRRILE